MTQMAPYSFIAFTPLLPDVCVSGTRGRAGATRRLRLRSASTARPTFASALTFRQRPGQQRQQVQCAVQCILPCWHELPSIFSCGRCRREKGKGDVICQGCSCMFWASGMNAVLVSRPGNAPLPEGHGFRVITSLMQVIE